MKVPKDEELGYPDFSNSEIAFQNKSDRELKETSRLFKAMNYNQLVDIGSTLAKISLNLRLPFVETIMKRTIFKQFCGGVNLMDCQDIIDHLYHHNTLTILDYGAESKTSKEDLDEAVGELMNAIEFAASNNSVPVVSCKLTALVDNNLLIKKQKNTLLRPMNRSNLTNFLTVLIVHVPEPEN